MGNVQRKCSQSSNILNFCEYVFLSNCDSDLWGGSEVRIADLFSRESIFDSLTVDMNVCKKCQKLILLALSALTPLTKTWTSNVFRYAKMATAASVFNNYLAANTKNIPNWGRGAWPPGEHDLFGDINNVLFSHLAYSKALAYHLFFKGANNCFSTFSMFGCIWLL